jgi:hypothetical protein
MKRFVLYKHRKHLYPAGATKLTEKIYFDNLTQDPNTILEQTQDFFLQKGWVFDKIASDSDLPIFLISKEETRIAISLAKGINPDEIIMIFVSTTPPKSADAQKIEELFNSMISQIK